MIKALFLASLRVSSFAHRRRPQSSRRLLLRRQVISRVATWLLLKLKVDANRRGYTDVYSKASYRNVWVVAI